MSEWKPDWSVPVGEMLREVLEDRGITQSALAETMGRPFKTVNEVINGKAVITAETAVQLEMALGLQASYWLRLQALDQEFHARRKLMLCFPEPPFPLTAPAALQKGDGPA